VFDALAPATAAADMTLTLLLHPERTARMIQQKALHPELPGLDDIFHRLMEGVFEPDFPDPYEAEVNRAVERVLVDRIMVLAARAPMAQVRAMSAHSLEMLADFLTEEEAGADGANHAHYSLLRQDIRRFLTRPQGVIAMPEAPDMPPGSPIGDPGMRWLDRTWSSGWTSYDWWW
jgi:hypothetical protein